jgi:hypothetical protein
MYAVCVFSNKSINIFPAYVGSKIMLSEVTLMLCLYYFYPEWYQHEHCIIVEVKALVMLVNMKCTKILFVGNSLKNLQVFYFR